MKFALGVISDTVHLIAGPLTAKVGVNADVAQW
jgi:hypothetical protein